jgi:hypothetical protein
MTCLRKARFISRVLDVSPSRPMMKFKPGSMSGRPFLPLSLPTSLIILIASIVCAEFEFRSFAVFTAGSALSNPKARTLPEVQYLAMDLRIFMDSTGWSEITAGFALST